MKSMKSLLLLNSAVLMLSACASYEADLAANGDWEELGYRDGIKGVTSRTVSNLNALGSPVMSDYESGYFRGVEEYCNPQFAYQIGLSGQYYEGVCDGTEEAQKFRMEWQRGWEESR